MKREETINLSRLFWKLFWQIRSFVLFRHISYRRATQRQTKKTPESAEDIFLHPIFDRYQRGNSLMAFEKQDKYEEKLGLSCLSSDILIRRCDEKRSNVNRYSWPVWKHLRNDRRKIFLLLFLESEFDWFIVLNFFNVKSFLISDTVKKKKKKKINHDSRQKKTDDELFTAKERRRKNNARKH